MLVDDKLAKEKLARVIDAVAEEYIVGYMKGTIEKCAQLIRNTDLTDCQQPPTDELRKLAERCRPAVRSHYMRSQQAVLANNVPHYASVLEQAEQKAGELINEIDRLLSIAPAPDQGSVRNATDKDVSMEEMERLVIATAMRERCAKACEELAKAELFTHLVPNQAYRRQRAKGAELCAMAIRALPVDTQKD